MWEDDDTLEKDVRENFAQQLKYNKQHGATPRELVTQQRRMNYVLSAFRDEIPFLSCRMELEKFELLQEATIENLLTIEKELFLYGYHAGQSLFQEALEEFFQLDNEVLLEMEKDIAVFIETFRNHYLLKYGDSFFTDAADYLEECGIPTQPELHQNFHVMCYTNMFYKLYTYLYENAPDEKSVRFKTTCKNTE